MDPLSAPMYSMQDFEVLCIRNGKTTLDALPDDLKRFMVKAETSMQARELAVSLAEKDGFTVWKPVPPGFITDIERQARIRASEMSLPKFDKSKI